MSTECDFTGQMIGNSRNLPRLGEKHIQGDIVQATNGGLAIAPNANTDVARAYLESREFFRIAAAARHPRWLLVLVAIAPIISLLARRRVGRAT